MLLDSNIFIYSTQSEYASLCEWCMNQDIHASDITKLEVLGYHRLSEEDRDSLQRLLGFAVIYPVSSPIIESAITLRQQKNMSLGDAIIAATALEHHQTLATRNLKDFDWVEGLKVVDPLADVA